jgi:hypothetical protein
MAGVSESLLLPANTDGLEIPAPRAIPAPASEFFFKNSRLVRSFPHIIITLLFDLTVLI